MALQTAPLGQLPSMNMPYSIPRYEKPVSVWEKALAAFLVNAAGQAAENTFQQENATRFGETPTPLYKKPFVGARVNARQAEQREADESAMMRENFRLDSQRKQQESEQGFQTSRDAAKYADESLLQQDSDRAARERLQATLQGQASQNTQSQEAAVTLEKLKALLEGQDPENLARTRYYDAQAAKARSDANWRDSFSFDAQGNPVLRGAGQGQGQGQPGSSEQDRARRKAVGQTTNTNTLPADFDWGEVSRAMADTPVHNAILAGSGVPPEMLNMLSSLLAQTQGGVELNEPATSSISAPPVQPEVEQPGFADQVMPYFDPTTPQSQAALGHTLDPIRELIRLLSGQTEEEYNARRLRARQP